MSRLTNIGFGVLVLASSALVLAGLDTARADTLNCQSSNGYCSLGSNGNYGSVTVTGLGTNTVDITYSLSVGDIADPADASVVFDITGATGATVLNNSNTSDYFGWTFFGSQDAFIGSQQIDADDGNAAYGIFSGGASCNDGNGCGQKVEIQVTGSHLELGSTGGYFAAIDTENTVCDRDGWNCNTETGAVADATDPSPTPLPGALPLFGTVLGAGFLGFRQRRRKVGAAVA